jgi:hypothetical protein
MTPMLQLGFFFVAFFVAVALLQALVRAVRNPGRSLRRLFSPSGQTGLALCVSIALYFLTSSQVTRFAMNSESSAGLFLFGAASPAGVSVGLFASRLLLWRHDRQLTAGAVFLMLLVLTFLQRSNLPYAALTLGPGLITAAVFLIGVGDERKARFER